MEILCIGLNHETAPVAVRERLALTGDSLQETLQWLKGQPGVQEALVLSTCNRVELYLVTEQEAGQVDPIIRQYFTDRFGLEEDAIRRVSLAGVEASWAPTETKARLTKRINDWWDAGE